MIIFLLISEERVTSSIWAFKRWPHHNQSSVPLGYILADDISVREDYYYNALGFLNWQYFAVYSNFLEQQERRDSATLWYLGLAFLGNSRKACFFQALDLPSQEAPASYNMALDWYFYSCPLFPRWLKISTNIRYIYLIFLFVPVLSFHPSDLTMSTLKTLC